MSDGREGRLNTGAAKDKGRAFWLSLLPPLLIGGAFLVGAAFMTQGRLDPPLDDSLIFFQFAKNTARGYVMTYQVGEGPTGGCTSLLWMAYLTVGWAIGWRGVLLGWFSALSGLTLLVISAAIGYRLLRALGATETVAALSAALVAAAGPVTYGCLTGTETGLFTALALATIYFGVRRSLGKFAASAALLSWARPEGAVAATVLALWYLFATGGLGRRRLMLLAVPGAILAWCALLYVSTGELSTNSYYAKSPLASFTGRARPADFYKLKLWLEPRSALKNELASSFGYVQRQRLTIEPRTFVARANRLLSAYAVRPVLLMGTALGLALAAARARRFAGAAAVAFASLLLTNALALGDEHFFYHRSRYGVPILTLALLVTAFGWGYVPPAFGRRRWLVFAPLLIFLPTTLAWGVCYANDAGCVFTFYRPIAEFIKKELGPEEVIATHDGGFLSYYTENRIIDLAGLGARRYAETPRNGGGSIVEVLERERPAPGYFFIYPGALPAVEATVVGTCLRCYFNETAGFPQFAEVCSANLSNCRADYPRRAVPGKEVVDTLDVADLISERAHDYRCGAFVCFDCKWLTEYDDGVIREYGQDFVRSGGSYARRASYKDGCEIVDGGRVIAESEEFAVATNPGRGAMLAMRTDRPMKRPVAVYVNDTFVGRWRWRAPRVGVWREVHFYVPSRFIKGNDTFRLVSEPLRHDINYTSFHYWVFQRRD